jgi:hypothetical protein
MNTASVQLRFTREPRSGERVMSFDGLQERVTLLFHSVPYY